MAELNVGDLMTENPICVRRSDSLALAYRLMDGENFRHLPVVDADGGLVGLLSHRDLLRHALGHLGHLPMTLLLEQLKDVRIEVGMVAGPESTTPDEPIASAAERMIEHKYGCLPVVEGQQVVGILTESDFVRYVSGTPT